MRANTFRRKGATIIVLLLCAGAFGDTLRRNVGGAIPSQQKAIAHSALHEQVSKLQDRIGQGGVITVDNNDVASFRGQYKLRGRINGEADAEGALIDALRWDDALRGFGARECSVLHTYSIGSQGQVDQRILRRFERKIKSMPLYRGDIVAVTNEQELIELYGSQVAEPKDSAHTRTEQEIRTIATRVLGSSASNIEIERSFFNPYLLDKNAKNATVPSWTIHIVEGAAREYHEMILDDEAGAVLFFDDFRRDALNRAVWDGDYTPWAWYTTPSMADAERIEGQPATGSYSVDNAYDLMGVWYSFFSKYNRDGFDGSGGQSRAYINSLYIVRDINRPCSQEPGAFNQVVLDDVVPNAHVSVSAFCAGMDVDDIIQHEQTHALVTSTAHFNYTNNIGIGLHEGFADAFACLMTKNWTLGENSVAGIKRRADNPSLDGYSINDWSQYSSNLNGHHLAGLLSHPAMLMAVGGAGKGGDVVLGRGYNITSDIYYSTLLRLLPNSTFQDWARIFVAEAKAGYSYGPRSTACDALMAVRSVGLDSGIGTDVCTDKKKNVMLLTMLRR